MHVSQVKYVGFRHEPLRCRVRAYTRECERERERGRCIVANTVTLPYTSRVREAKESHYCSCCCWTSHAPVEYIICLTRYICVYTYVVFLRRQRQTDCIPNTHTHISIHTHKSSIFFFRCHCQLLELTRVDSSFQESLKASSFVRPRNVEWIISGSCLAN